MKCWTQYIEPEKKSPKTLPVHRSYCSFCLKEVTGKKSYIKKYSNEDFYRIYCEDCHRIDYPDYTEEYGYKANTRFTSELLQPDKKSKEIMKRLGFIK